jgi:hypothetical protein
MREEYLAGMKQLEKVNLAESPNYLLLKLLGNSEDAVYPSKSLIAAKIKINVNREFIQDEEVVNQTVKTYVSCLNKIWVELVKDFGYDNAKQIMLQIAGDMSITYTL